MPDFPTDQELLEIRTWAWYIGPFCQVLFNMIVVFYLHRKHDQIQAYRTWALWTANMIIAVGLLVLYGLGYTVTDVAQSTGWVNVQLVVLAALVAYQTYLSCKAADQAQKYLRVRVPTATAIYDFFRLVFASALVYSIALALIKLVGNDSVRIVRVVAV